LRSTRHNFYVFCRCAPDPDERWTAERCLLELHTPVAAADGGLHTTVAPVPAVDAPFNYVCKFVDKFCASGHFRGSAEVTFAPLGVNISFTFENPQNQNTFSCYKRLQPVASWPLCLFRCPEWLLVRDGSDASIPQSALVYTDCLTPDFYVQPLHSHVRGNVQPRGIFLPRNLFCYGIGQGHLLPGMLDVSSLTLLHQSEWFTVFRYELLPGKNIIIK
jgi:hypothetical protein